MAATGRTIQRGVILALRTASSRSSLIKTRLGGPKVLHETLRLSSTSATPLQQQQQQVFAKIVKNEGSNLSEVKREGKCLSITFEDASRGCLPFLWMRDNCQCPKCFDKVALGRNFLMQSLDTKAEPKDVNFDGTSIQVTWSDGHESPFDSKWLYQRAFNPEARKNYRDFYRLPREPWGSDLKLDKFRYEDLKSNDKALLQWLMTMETKGVALVTNSPDDPDAGAQLIDHIGFVKQSHYGRRSPVLVRENSNNVAFTNIKLGLHNDLTQYYHQPGMIFIQTVRQHKGKGGESTISDGLFGVQQLQKTHPKQFELLSTRNVYFWDKGTANIDMEVESFYKISKGPIVGLDSKGELETLRVNNQVRDSHLDLPAEEVNDFYEAMKTLDDILYQNSYNFKMNDGDILTLDNVRCLHGREGYEFSSDRHLESAYLDWDEALCRRRKLVEKLLH